MKRIKKLPPRTKGQWKPKTHDLMGGMYEVGDDDDPIFDDYKQNLLKELRELKGMYVPEDGTCRICNDSGCRVCSPELF